MSRGEDFEEEKSTKSSNCISNESNLRFRKMSVRVKDSQTKNTNIKDFIEQLTNTY